MGDYNSVGLIGRLTRDAELRYTNSGQPVSKFSIAINKRRKQGEEWTEEAHFFDVVLWGKVAESLDKYLTKGKQVAIDGELSQNRQDGQSRSRVEIIANKIQLLGGGQESSSGKQNQWQGQQQQNPYKRQTYQQKSQPVAATNNEDMFLDFPDDIPF